MSLDLLYIGIIIGVVVGLLIGWLIIPQRNIYTIKKMKQKGNRDSIQEMNLKLIPKKKKFRLFKKKK